MVRKAAQFVLQNGPVSQQDRWEEDPGYSPFTLAVEISALVLAAELAEKRGEVDSAAYLRQTADAWNASIEGWTYVSGTDLAHEVGVDGYYVRIAPPDTADASSPAEGFVPIKNRPPGQNLEPAKHIVSPDALALVRFGLRSAEDPRIVNTIKVIDALLKTETPAGPIWHRYNDDGYGEHENGDPFDGTGIGRPWPLLTGERGHYELAAGNRQRAQNLLDSITAFSNEGGLLPEQIWDADDIPEKELFFGRPAGSAMPLVWAHAEYVKLCRSLADGVVFDMPPQTVKRYVQAQTGSIYAIWRFNHKRRTIPAGQILRLELSESAAIRWSSDNWHTTQGLPTRDTGLGLHVADLDTSKLAPGSELEFTFYQPDKGQEQEENFTVFID
jgi:glucoamylase